MLCSDMKFFEVLTSIIDQKLHSLSRRIVPILPPSPCQGSEAHWELGFPYRTYPFAFHDHDPKFKPGYQIIRIDSFPSTICIRSLNCLLFASPPSTSCVICNNAIATLKNVEDRARRSLATLNRWQLILHQLMQRLEEVEASEKKMLCLM